MRRCAWAAAGVLAKIGLTGARPAAQQQTGTLTGTIVDDSGGMVPGATIAATEAGTGIVRSSLSDDDGVFRMAALPPGRYSLRAERAGFTSVNMKEISVSSAEVRDLGKLELEVGTQEAEITVTAEVTPVQVASSARTSAITSDQLTNIQMKGRDVTINGAPVTNKNVLVDGICVVDEGGAGNAFVNPNIDAVGEAQVIAMKVGRPAGALHQPARLVRLEQRDATLQACAIVPGALRIEAARDHSVVRKEAA
jgi:hypothetical protein